MHSYLTKSLFDGATYLVARRIDAAVGPAAVAILVRRDVQADRGPPPTGHRSVRCGIGPGTRRSLWIRGRSSVLGTPERRAVVRAAASARDRAWAGVHVT